MTRFDTALLFEPIYMERVWGGNRLAAMPGRTMPQTNGPIGESWELVDRHEAVSVVANGTAQGMSLAELWNGYRVQVFGEDALSYGRCQFPLLIKVLDCGDDLSLQVHPPQALAAELCGEPKTEMWYVYEATPDARLIAGVKRGVTRDSFRAALSDKTVTECVHQLHTVAGDSLFVPSGRLHALGKGLVVFEVQQNSDTTYRVYDWDRLGLDGKARDLHVEASLKCIDFADVEPALRHAELGESLAGCEYFSVSRCETGQSNGLPQRTARIIMAITETTWGGVTVMPGRVAIWPACVPPQEPQGEWLDIELPIKH